jgi:hypothetical protein
MGTRLSEIRAIIRRAVPAAIEVFSNDMPGYVLHDSLVWFAGIDQDVALYPRGYHFKKVYAAELVGYKTPKGCCVKALTRLERVVFTTYGWPSGLSDEEILEKGTTPRT